MKRICKHSLRGCYWVAAYLFFVVLGVSQARAGLVDQTFGFQWLAPNTSTVYDPSGHTGFTFPDAVVGPGVEFPGADDGVFDVDLSDTNILLDNFNYFLTNGTFSPAAFNGIELTDVSATVAINSVTLDPATIDAVGFNASDISFDAEHIFINLEDVTWTDGLTKISLDVGSTSAIPEPGSLRSTLIALIMFAGIGMLKRSHNRL